ncbi:MAG: TIGR03790 family protein [Candidatus Brocadiales bacterium]
MPAEKDKRLCVKVVILLFFLALSQLGFSSLYALPSESILVVVNDRSPASREIAQYYQRMRNVPPENLCHLDCTEEEEIDRQTFNTQLRDPIVNHLKKYELEDKILYIITTSGIPLKIKGSGGLEGDMASVDSELTMLYRFMLHGSYKLQGAIPNPYFAGNIPPSRYTHFNRKDFDIYLVTRLTAYTANEAKSLIRKSLKAGPGGWSLIDDKQFGHTQARRWMQETKNRLEQAGISVIIDTTSKYITGAEDVMSYCGWGSNDKDCKGRFPGFRWKDGAIATTFVSFNARTFQEPPGDWTIGKWDDPNSFYAGAPQSLIGDLVRDGVTGSVGYTYEPYLMACARPYILFPAYVSGFNLAESYYMSLPFLSWQAVVVGDPVCSPYEGFQVARGLRP